MILNHLAKIFLILLFFLSITLLYLLKLDRLPLSFHGDEAETALQTLEILKGNVGIIGVGWYDLPLLSFIPDVITMRIFGINIWGIRSGSVLFGILTIPIFYFLTELLFTKRVALIATILLTTSHLWIALSRIGITYVQATFIMLTTLYFLFKGLKSEQKIYFVLAGIFLGLSFYSYYAARILPLVIFIPLFFYIFKRGYFKSHLLNFLFFCFSAMIVFLPQLLFFLQHPQSFFSRTNSVYIFSETGKQWTNYNKNILETLWLQFLATINIFAGDNSTQYGYKGMLLDYFTLIFLIIGIIYSLIFLKRKGLFLLFWFVLAIVGQVLTTIPTPFFLPRFVVGLPVIFIYCALGFEFVFKIFPKNKVVLYFLSFFVILLIILFNLNIYFVEYPKQLKLGIAGGGFHNSSPIKIARFINSLPESEKIIFLTEPSFSSDHGTIRFISSNKNIISEHDSNFYLSNLINRKKTLGENTSIYEGNNASTTYIIYPEYSSKMNGLIRLYPQGKLSKFTNDRGEVEFLTFRTN